MSIVRNKVKSVTDLIKLLKIENDKFHNCNPSQLLSQVWQSVEDMWEDVDLNNFTDHGIGHSLAIIDYFLQLDEDIYNWSNYEKFIFAISSLIHDIGMQYNKWGCSVKLSNISSPPLTPDKIRKYHTIAGYELIEKQRRNGLLNSFPGKLFDNTSWGQCNTIHHAQHIAFAHSGKRYLKKLIIDNSTWKIRPDYQGGKFRPRLLAGTLRICDELDLNFERILQPNRIEASNLNETNRVHWLSCLFVEATELEVKKFAIYINIKWQIPTTSTNDQKNLIKDLLRRMRETKIKREINFVNEFYEQCGENYYCKYTKNIYVKPLSNEPSFIKVPTSFDNMVNLLKKSEKHQTFLDIPESNLFKERLNRGRKELTSCLYSGKPSNAKIIRVKSIKLEKRLKNWFEENREPGHFELINGEHTDTYLYCRTLVSDQELLGVLAKHIWKLHKKHNIKNILAVGTSAIPLAVNLSFLLKCSVTYTIWKVWQENIFPIEAIPLIKDGENILIIDDVVSSGKVVKEILNFVEKSLRKKIGKVYHHAIFRLGNRKISPDKRINKYFWVKHIKNIMYASSSKKCPFCKKGEIPQKEEDMF